MTDPSPPSSPFEQVVEAIYQRIVRAPWAGDYTEHGLREIAAAYLQAALDTGLLKLVEERPEEWAPESEVLSTPVVIEAIKEGVREYETWKQSLEQPSSKPAPRTSKDLEQQAGELLDGAEAHELYSMFLAHDCSSEIHPRHPLITGAEKLAAMQDEYHARFSEVLSDDDDPLAEQPRGEPSVQQVEAAAKEAFWEDDLGGHIKGKWTWDTIPGEGRQNYRKMIRAALRAANAIDTTVETSEGRWRVCRKVGRTIYWQRGTEPSDDDPLVGTMNTPELARVAVKAMNLAIDNPSGEERNA